MEKIQTTIRQFLTPDRMFGDSPNGSFVGDATVQIAAENITYMFINAGPQYIHHAAIAGFVYHAAKYSAGVNMLRIIFKGN